MCRVSPYHPSLLALCNPFPALSRPDCLEPGFPLGMSNPSPPLLVPDSAAAWQNTSRPGKTSVISLGKKWRQCTPGTRLIDEPH